MKTLRLLLVLAFTVTLAGRSFAQAPDEVAPDAAVPEGAGIVHFTPEQLDQLLGPIALYPDALIAIILPASAVPADIVLAARHLQDTNNDLSQVENRAWDESVKSLAHYPDVLRWMDQNLTWTKQLGEAFTGQSAEVMQAIQRLRARARAAGTLTDTPQQQIVADAEVIRIVPAQPDVIYVPYYDPQIVYVDRPAYYPQPFLTFGFGYSVGSWLAFDCDWHRRTIWVGDRHRRWSEHHDWHRPIVPPPSAIVSNTAVVNRVTVRQWHPPVRPPRPGFASGDPTRPIVHTTPSLSNTYGRTAVTSPAAAAPQVDRIDNPARPAVSDHTRRDTLTSRRAPITTSTAAPVMGPTPPPNVSVQGAPVPAQAPATLATPTPAPATWSRDRTVHTRSYPSAPVATQAPAPTYNAPAYSAPVRTAPAPTYNAPAYSAPVHTAPAYSHPTVAPAAAPAPVYRAPAPGPLVSAPPPAPAPAAPTPAPAQNAPQEERRYRGKELN